MVKASIIIPVFNDAKNIGETLTCITEQIDSWEKYEVIVVDNGSTDDTRETVRRFKQVTLLEEHRYLNSPYSARNRGIEKSSGEIVILLDATCKPTKDWLKAGIAALEEQECDLVGGKVSFGFETPTPTIAELHDAITNIRMKASIQEKGVAKTANLLIKRKVFNKIGVFPEGIRSGGDVRWTAKATQAGFKLLYSQNAEVIKKARKLKPLLKKQWRVSKAQPVIWIENGKQVSVIYLVLRLIQTIFLFPATKDMSQKISSSDYNLEKKTILKVHFLHYFLSIVMGVGNIYGYIFIK